MTLRRFIPALALAVASLIAPAAEAQDYPSRPVTILVGLAPGGITDVMARLYAQELQRKLGQNFIVENRPAASGATAASGLQRAAPDGYTLLLFSGAQHATIPALSANPIYDPVKGAEPVGVVFNFAAVVAVPAESPVRSINDLVTLSANKPAGLNFGSPGVGTPSHLAGAKLVAATKTKAEFVQYKGGAPMITDLVAGRLDVAWPSSPLAKSFIEAKTIRALAIDGAQRLKVAPDVPTLKELGYGDVSVANWFAVAASPGTPPDVIKKLNAAFVEANQDPVLRAKVEDLGLSVANSTPEELGQLMAKEATDIRALVQKLGIATQ